MQQDPSLKRLVEHVRRNLIPMIERSEIVVSIVPHDQSGTDVKFALELGYSVMLDKPIIAVVRPGTKIPEKLARVVDRFVECDDPKSPGLTERLAEALHELLPKGGK